MHFSYDSCCISAHSLKMGICVWCFIPSSVSARVISSSLSQSLHTLCNISNRRQLGEHLRLQNSVRPCRAISRWDSWFLLSSLRNMQELLSTCFPSNQVSSVEGFPEILRSTHSSPAPRNRTIPGSNIWSLRARDLTTHHNTLYTTDVVMIFKYAYDGVDGLYIAWHHVGT